MLHWPVVSHRGSARGRRNLHETPLADGVFDDRVVPMGTDSGRQSGGSPLRYPRDPCRPGRPPSSESVARNPAGMKILALIAAPPDPPVSGTRIRNFHLWPALARRGVDVR